MNKGRTVFSQLTDFLPLHEFRKCVRRYGGDRRVRCFSCLDQFLAMAFAQLTWRESLRDIEVCLRAVQSKLYHMGVRGGIARNTLAKANEQRDWRIYADFAHVLIRRARLLYADEDLGVELDQTAYALDATIIDLCLSLFPWARFRKRKAAVKVHTLLDLRGSIPSFIAITEGRLADMRMLDQLAVEAGAIYVMDRGYLDFRRLYRITQAQAFFVIRAKRNTGFQRRSSTPVDKTTGLRSDQRGILTGQRAMRRYHAAVRCVRYYDEQNDLVLDFLTNNFALPAITIANLYRLRWQVELFFKWIKQHLRIKAFYGTSENAVKTQIWIAVTIYVLVLIAKKELKLQASPYTILQVLSITLFEKTLISQALEPVEHVFCEQPLYTQLSFLDF